MIEGSWQMDSTLHYYNHFQYLETGDEKVFYHYKADTLIISKAEEVKAIGYVLEQDTLKWFDQSRKQITSAFQVLTLKPNCMILRETLKPLYEQPNQQRYRQYYFSRID